MIHPARTLPFETLFNELQSRVDAGLIATRDDGDLRLYCYTRRCIYDKQWDDFTMMARGLVLDLAKRKVVATPFPKFFNYGERTTDLPDEPFEAYEKVDGSLGIVFHDGQRWRCATKGSFDSEQAKWAETWLGSRMDQWHPGATYLFEIVYAANRIVVRYNRDELVLLGVYTDRGYEATHNAVQEVAREIGCRSATAYSFDAISDALAHVATLDANNEGFVIRYASGYRIKIKGEAYLRIHRAISRVTPLGVWELMEAGDDLEVVRQGLPEECWQDFDDIRGILVCKYQCLVASVLLEAMKWSGATDKEVGLALSTIPPDARPFIFAARRNPNWRDDPKTRRGLFRAIRPTGNRLDGYEPGRLVTAIAEGE